VAAGLRIMSVDGVDQLFDDGPGIHHLDMVARRGRRFPFGTIRTRKGEGWLTGGG
jgi:hypothetical protein